MDSTRNVTNAECQCPAGAGKKCKHIAALVHYINQEDAKSKTDFEKQWGKPSKAGEQKYKKGKTISELFIPKKKFKTNDLVEVNHIELVSNYNILDIPCSFSKLLSVETKTELDRECESCVKWLVDQTEINELYSRHGPSLDFILVRQKLINFSNFNNFYKFPLNINEYNYYLNNIVVNDNEVKKIFIQTIKQSESKTWVEQRKIRISATKTHQVINTRMSYQKVANILMSNSVLKGKASINVCYGIMTEKTAIESYLKTYTECDYIECGLIIHTEYPWICASPDGLIIKNGKVDRVLEIKCPISCTNTPIETGGKLNLSYLKYDSYGKVTLKPTHTYYTQCQFLMFCTGLTKCDLFIFNYVKPLLITVERNNNFISLAVSKIEQFYFSTYLTELSLKK